MQTKVAQEAAAYLSDKIKHQVTIGRVDIELFSNVILEQVKVLDYRNQEMFYVGRTEANISTFSIFHPNTLTIASLELQEPRANLIFYEGSDTLNLSSFFNALGNLFTKDTTQKTSEPFNFSLDELVVQNGRFTYDDFNKPEDAFGIDYVHMTVDRISGKFDDINLGDTIKVNISDLSAFETRSDTKLQNLDCHMTFAPTFWEWADLNLQINQSNLQNFVRFDYNRFGNFTQFIDSVTVTANLQNSKVYSKDIAIFVSSLREYDENIQVNTIEITGKANNFSAKNIDVAYGQHTHIVGSLSADGFPNFKEVFANVRLQPSSINAGDIKQFLSKDTYDVAARLGTVNLEGRFLGFYNDFVANATFATALGRVVSDINLKIDDDTRSSSYEGYLKTNNFKLGRLVNNTDLIKTVSMEGRVKGSGFTLETANLNLNATVNQLQLIDYNYRNIKVNGTLNRQTFSGHVGVNDPNLIFTADGDINLASGNKAFNMHANLEHVNLHALKLSDSPLMVSTNANLNFQGLSLDTFEGTAILDSAQIAYNGENLAIDSVTIESVIAEGQRSLNLNSELLTLQVSGNFNYSTLIDDLSNLVQEYKLNFDSNDAATVAYYNNKPQRTDEYNLAYEINLKQANPLLHLYLPELSISDYTKVEGSFRHSNTVILDMYSNLDTIQYNNFTLYNSNIELNTSKLQQSSDVLASLIITSREQVLSNDTHTKDFYLEGIWNERTIDFATSLREPQQNSRATITGDINFLQNYVQLVFDKSNVTLLETPWVFNPGNTVYISQGGKHIVFENFSIANQDQEIQISGALSEDPNSTLRLNINNFDLRNLNPLLSMKLNGSLSAEVVAQDFYNRAVINSTMQVDSFQMDNIFIGNINGRSDWNNERQQMAVDAGINRNNKKVLSVTGNYNPQAPEDQLDLLAIMDDSQLKLAEPFLRPIFSNLEGTMNGRIRVLGNLDYPVLKGSVQVNSGQFTFDYLNTTYRFSDRIYFDANSISFRNARLQDIYGNTATVTGGIAHDGFSNMVLDISARYRNFMVLNTTANQNELFYGTAFASGTASVLGPTDNLQINVDARSNANTRIVLPLDNQTNVARKDFIRFVNHNLNDTTGVAGTEEVNQQVDLSGINLNFELAVTDDAYFEILIDRTTGDMIRGSGNGDIRMTIDTRGDFHMYGNFEITQGAYNLNLLEGLVTREFKVKPGGTITWNGDPLAGIMDLTATYTQMASIGGLGLDDQSSDFSARIPVTAVVDLAGPILTPQIKLGLSFDEAQQQPQVVDIIKSAIQNDENELNRQVFSLLVLRRLSPVGTVAFNEGAAGAVGGSLGSLLSGQLSSFLNTIDSNLEIDIGLDAIDQDALSALQVRLSYTFFQGRLRVTSETGFGSTTSDGTNSGRNRYQGDWSLEYYITRSGELRGRLEYNTIPQGFSSRTRVTSSQSISLLHTKRFDTLRELFGANRNSRRYRRQEEERERIILDSDPRRNLQ
ncbi:translocation/assembly module TamB [Pontibacter silvestris]|nr:translocation/assembly module TamB domain-containing protein [Pontibacter silvestris]MCC9135145.1 translocation/assembly module TamB [Pontibacter silvestris]